MRILLSFAMFLFYAPVQQLVHFFILIFAHRANFAPYIW